MGGVVGIIEAYLPWGGFAGFLLGFFWWRFGDLYKYESSRGRWIARLRHDGFGRRYRDLLGGVLDWIDATLSPPGPGAPRSPAARSWSPPLLDLCMLLAATYPLSALALHWALTGATGGVDAGQMFDPAIREDARWVTFIAFAASVYVAVAAAFQPGVSPLLLTSAGVFCALFVAYAVVVGDAMAMLFAGVATFAVIGGLIDAFLTRAEEAFDQAPHPLAPGRVGVGPNTLAMVAASAAAVWHFGPEATGGVIVDALLVAVGAFAGALVLAFIAVVFLGAAARNRLGLTEKPDEDLPEEETERVTIRGMRSGGPAGLLLGVTTAAFLLDDMVGVWVALGAGALSVAAARAGRAGGAGGMAYTLAFTMALLAGGVLLLRLPPAGETAVAVGAMALVLGPFAVLNALSDFLSVGLTRYILRRGLHGNLVLNSLIDLVAAVAILVGLGCAMIAVVALAQPPDGPPLLDLPRIFEDLRGPEWTRYGWLIFCFLSTLAPTAVHLGVGAFGAFTLGSKRLGRPIAEMLRAGADDPLKGRDACALLAIGASSSVFLPCFLLYHALASFGRSFLDAMVAVFEDFAKAVGAM